MERKIYMEDRSRILGQVNLRMASMQLQNMEADKKGERRQHLLDNVTRLNIFFELMGNQHCAVGTQPPEKGQGAQITEVEELE